MDLSESRVIIKLWRHLKIKEVNGILDSLTSQNLNRKVIRCQIAPGILR